MRDIYLASPPAPPAPIEPGHMARQGFRMTWRTWEGQTWDLTDPKSGAFLLQDSVKGIGMPEIKRYTRTSPALHGGRYRGWIAEERDILWPLHLYHDGESQQWVDFDRRFWRSMRPDKTGVWRVTQPDGHWRELTCRYESGGDGFGRDPAQDGWATYPLSLVAEQPFWEGEPIVRNFAQPTQRNFYGGGALPGQPGYNASTAKAAPFYISAASTTARAVMSNPGDVAVWPIWTIHAPFSAVTLTVDAHQLTWPGYSIFENAEGTQGLRIDTRPEDQQAINRATGEDFTRWVNPADFAPIEPGAEVEVGIEMVGTGYVQCEIRPQYMRAW